METTCGHCERRQKKGSVATNFVILVVLSSSCSLASRLSTWQLERCRWFCLMCLGSPLQTFWLFHWSHQCRNEPWSPMTCLIRRSLLFHLRRHFSPPPSRQRIEWETSSRRPELLVGGASVLLHQTLMISKEAPPTILSASMEPSPECLIPLVSSSQLWQAPPSLTPTLVYRQHTLDTSSRTQQNPTEYRWNVT